MSEDLINVIPSSYGEAEELINKFYQDASTQSEKSWSTNEEEDAEKELAEPQKGFDMKRIDPKLLAKKDPAANPQPSTPQSPFELEIDGQKMQFSPDDMKKYLQSGYKAEQRYSEILKEQQKISQERAEFEKNRGKYEHMAKLDDWAKQNPELYNRLTLEHENMQNGGQFGDVPPYLSKFVADLDQIKSRFSEIDSFTNNQKIQEEDRALDNEIAQFKKDYPQFDWKDASVEKSILLHAQQNRIGNFRAAARDYFFDDLTKRTAIQAKVEVGKEIQKNYRLGEVQKKSEFTYTQKPTNIRKQSYDQLAQEAAKRFGHY